MEREIIARLKITFEEYVKESDGVEFWFARDLQVLLGYTEWRNFLLVIDKAKESCKNAMASIDDHFVDVSKKVKLVIFNKPTILNF